MGWLLYPTARGKRLKKTIPVKKNAGGRNRTEPEVLCCEENGWNRLDGFQTIYVRLDRITFALQQVRHPL